MVSHSLLGAAARAHATVPLPNRERYHEFRDDDSLGGAEQCCQRRGRTAIPNTTAPASSILLLVGSNITGPTGQNSTRAITRGIESNRAITDLASVDSVYTAYQSYLQGTATLALGFLGPALLSSPSLVTTSNAIAQLIFGPPALYFRTWSSFVSTHPGPAQSWNYPAYKATVAQLGGNATALGVLAAFYNGGNATNGGFNGTANCAANAAGALSCSDAAVRSQIGAILPALFPAPNQQPLPRVILGNLGIENYTLTLSQRTAASQFLAVESGLAGGLFQAIWTAFPLGTASPNAVVNWTTAVIANGTTATYPIPIPALLLKNFVNVKQDAAILVLSFTVSDGYTDSRGNTPVYSDLNTISALVPSILKTTDPTRTISFYQTGQAPLDQNENADLNSSLAIVFPLTFVVLLGITIVYFRAPLAPLITFGGLGIALVLGLGGVVLIGSLITRVDVTALELETTFVLGVGTDYSIFLLARYREEITRGAEPKEAVVTAVTWAGTSIATSGATAILATLALSFSGVALLSQWGMVLSLSVLMTLLIALTLVPAVLVLLGPRVFWPVIGERFRRDAARCTERIRGERTYFYRSGRRSQQRPAAVTALVLVASITLVYVALNVPLSFDFYEQLPGGHSATDGLKQLGNHFGPGFAFPTELLVTFQVPLLAGNQTNVTEFSDLSSVTSGIQSSPSVASVASPVGANNLSLWQWIAFPTLPLGTRSQMQGVLNSFVGLDGKTVLLTVLSTASGLSATAVHMLQGLKGFLRGFQSTHPEIAGLAFGGGASVTNDLQQQTSLATERMVLAVSVGLIVVLLVVLRSWIIPLFAVATIGLSIGWAWGITGLVLQKGLNLPLFFFAPTILFILILGLGIDYNIFLLTRVREERLRGKSSSEAVVEAVGTTGGIITAAAVILASAFAVLIVGNFLLLQVIGFAVATAIVLDAMVVRTYLVPAALQLFGERVWNVVPFRRKPQGSGSDPPPAESKPR